MVNSYESIIFRVGLKWRRDGDPYIDNCSEIYYSVKVEVFNTLVRELCENKASYICPREEFHLITWQQYVGKLSSTE